MHYRVIYRNRIPATACAKTHAGKAVNSARVNCLLLLKSMHRQLCCLSYLRHQSAFIYDYALSPSQDTELRIDFRGTNLWFTRSVISRSRLYQGQI